MINYFTRWKYNTWIRMKKESLARGEKPIEINERPAIDALSVDDLQSTFFLVVIFCIVSVFAFAAEQIKRIFGEEAHRSRF